MGIIIAVILLVALIAGGIWFFLRQKKTKRNVFARYEEKALHNKNHLALFGRLCRALPDCYIFPQVTLSDLIEPFEGDRQKNPTPFEQIETLKVDYAVFDGELVLVCVINLDVMPSVSVKPLSDEDIELRERSLKSASIKAFQWNLTAKPSVEQISRAILPLIEGSKGEEDSGDPLNPDTVQRIYSSDPVTDRPRTDRTEKADRTDSIIINNPAPASSRGLTPDQLDEMTPNRILVSNYPHIWQRICLFAPEPSHLQKYLLSLSIQDRQEKRAGFPLEAMKEISDIQAANDRFLMNPLTGWHKSSTAKL